MNAETRAALAQASGFVGCGDNSCRFVKPSGVGTNGGCRCADKPFVMAALAALYKAALKEAELKGM